jgi:hypothetical protein
MGQIKQKANLVFVGVVFKFIGLVSQLSPSEQSEKL